MRLSRWCVPLIFQDDEPVRAETDRAVDLAAPGTSGNPSDQRGETLQSHLHPLPCERRTEAQGDHDAEND